LKAIFEVERLSGKTVRAIKQDFYGVLFLATLESVLGKRDEEALAEQQRKRQKKKNGVYQINRAVSYVGMVERVVELLLSEQESGEILNQLHHLFRTNPSQARTGRHNERNKALRYAHKLRYHKYKKRVIA